MEKRFWLDRGLDDTAIFWLYLLRTHYCSKQAGVLTLLLKLKKKEDSYDRKQIPSRATHFWSRNNHSDMFCIFATKERKRAGYHACPDLFPYFSKAIGDENASIVRAIP